MGHVPGDTTALAEAADDGRESGDGGAEAARHHLVERLLGLVGGALPAEALHGGGVGLPQRRRRCHQGRHHGGGSLVYDPVADDYRNTDGVVTRVQPPPALARQPSRLRRRWLPRAAAAAATGSRASLAPVSRHTAAARRREEREREGEDEERMIYVGPTCQWVPPTLSVDDKWVPHFFLFLMPPKRHINATWK
uniref:Uncharacterized protein n=1 Tax=Oryza glumipatula TaxID=40148 RepID=A0A0D9YXJ3_9ORYZ